MLLIQKLRPLSAAIALSLGVATAGLSTAASAAPMEYDFNFTATSATVGNFSGKLTVDNGLATAITGSGSVIGTITGLLAPGAFGGNDNRFFPESANSLVNGRGLSFSSSNFPRLNLYMAGTNYIAWAPVPANGNNFSMGSFSATPSPVFSPALSPVSNAVPEPGALALALLALAGVAATRRARPAATPA